MFVVDGVLHFIRDALRRRSVEDSIDRLALPSEGLHDLSKVVRAEIEIGERGDFWKCLKPHFELFEAAEVANKWRISLYNAVVSGERASSTRMRYVGKICCECKMPLPPPHRPGERLCQKCCGGTTKHRVYMQFVHTKGWLCRFLEPDLKTPLPRKVTVRHQKKLFEMAGRGGVHLGPAGRYSIQKAIEQGRGGIWLELSEEQYAKLKRP